MTNITVSYMSRQDFSKLIYHRLKKNRLHIFLPFGKTDYRESYQVVMPHRMERMLRDGPRRALCPGVHTCVAPSHSIPGLTGMTKRINQKHTRSSLNVTNDFWNQTLRKTMYSHASHNNVTVNTVSTVAVPNIILELINSYHLVMS